MKFPEWLDAEIGRQKRLADALGKTSAAISQWRTNGVPVDLMMYVVEFTGGAVSLEEMVAAKTPDRLLPERIVPQQAALFYTGPDRRRQMS